MLPQRFWDKVDKTTDDCWTWLACINPSGYGMFLVERSGRLAHRLAYMDCRGSIPDGLVADHRCGNRRCVNPWHLDLVTPEENTRRGRAGQFWSSKSHCPQGHEYSPENTYTYSGKRACRTCRRAAWKRYRNK